VFSRQFSVVSEEERNVGDGRACGHGFGIQLPVVSCQFSVAREDEKARGG
jgi:hypothetical protein